MMNECSEKYGVVAVFFECFSCKCLSANSNELMFASG